MAARNLPPSFFNANYHLHAKSCGMAAGGGDLYSEYSSGLHHLAAHAAATQDPWQYAAQVQGLIETRVHMTNLNGSKGSLGSVL